MRALSLALFALLRLSVCFLRLLRFLWGLLGKVDNLPTRLASMTLLGVIIGTVPVADDC